MDYSAFSMIHLNENEKSKNWGKCSDLSRRKSSNRPKPKHCLFTIVNDRQQVLILANTWHVLLEKSLEQSINYWNSCRFIFYRSTTDYSSICCSSDGHSNETAERLLRLSQCDHTTMTSNREWWRCSWAESEWCRGPDHGQILKWSVLRARW